MVSTSKQLEKDWEEHLFQQSYIAEHLPSFPVASTQPQAQQEVQAERHERYFVAVFACWFISIKYIHVFFTNVNGFGLVQGENRE